MNLHYEVHDGQGPFLLLVHGILSSRAQWALNLDALSMVTTPVVVELWGHGRSPAPDDPASYSPEGYIDAFEAVRSELGTDRWVVCGQSLGAALTLRYALERPQRVIAQVFTNSSSALADDAWRHGVEASLPQLVSDIETRGLDAVRALRIHPHRARRLPALVKDAIVADADALDLTGLINAFRYTVPASSVRDRVAETSVPTLLVAGRRERVFDSARLFAINTIAGLEVVDLDGGHAVNAEASAEFNTAVIDFVKGVVPA
jgi:2-succinyl-6-hydroxy-2,4-cyclohexadiene-1-carboxylate synthase